MWYGTLVVWHDGTERWFYNMAKYCLVVWYVSGYKVCKSRIRRTNIMCNELLIIYQVSIIGTNYLVVELVRKYKGCGQTDRQIHRQICNYQNRDSVLQTYRTIPGMYVVNALVCITKRVGVYTSRCVHLKIMSTGTHVCYVLVPYRRRRKAYDMKRHWMRQ